MVLTIKCAGYQCDDFYFAVSDFLKGMYFMYKDKFDIKFQSIRWDGMWSYIFGLLISASIGSAFAVDRTPQEAAALEVMRQNYIRVTGSVPTPEDEQKMLSEWKATVIRDTARMSATSTATQSTPSVSPNAQFNLPVGGASGIQKMMQAAMQRAQNGSAAVPVAATISAPVVMSDADLLKNISGKHAPTKVQISARRDGLMINGRVFADPEGRMTTYAYDVVSGDVTYQIATAGGFVFKFFNPSTGVEPVVIGSASGTGSGLQVSLVNGSTLGGDSVIPMPKGLIVARGANLFVYEPGKTIQTVSLPDGWALAQFQRGSVGATRTILLENASALSQSKDRSGLGSLISSAQSLGQMLGTNKKEDYAFMNIDSGNLIKLNISVEGKTQTVMSNCRRRNSFVNECATATSFESLYAPDGSRNKLHYFWQINWYQTPSGPIGIAQEGGLVDVSAIDLNTGKRVTLFHRAMGITSIDTYQSGDGLVTVSANWMFQDHVINDVAGFLASNPDSGSDSTKK
ncbi:MAG: hypothetical protein E6Q31_07330 [Aquabacterium sp.]|nr:MAG: hypothetical protein E6Q31_07330 [Aquabacterium sp.]